MNLTPTEVLKLAYERAKARRLLEELEREPPT